MANQDQQERDWLRRIAEGKDVMIDSREDGPSSRSSDLDEVVGWGVVISSSNRRKYQEEEPQMVASNKKTKVDETAVDGITKLVLPPGFSFIPSDEDIITHYLTPKVRGWKLPYNYGAINDVPDDLELIPDQLAARYASSEQKGSWYFFCPRLRKYPNGKRPDRQVAGGYWKAASSNSRVQDRKKETIGYVQTLNFFMGDPMRGKKSAWMMQEYQIKESNQSCGKVLDSHVLCRMYKSARKRKDVEQCCPDTNSTPLVEQSTPALDSNLIDSANGCYDNSATQFQIDSLPWQQTAVQDFQYNLPTQRFDLLEARSSQPQVCLPTPDSQYYWPLSTQLVQNCVLEEGSENMQILRKESKFSNANGDQFFCSSTHIQHNCPPSTQLVQNCVLEEGSENMQITSNENQFSNADDDQFLLEILDLLS